MDGFDSERRGISLGSIQYVAVTDGAVFFFNIGVSDFQFDLISVSWCFQFWFSFLFHDFIFVLCILSFILWFLFYVFLLFVLRFYDFYVSCLFNLCFMISCFMIFFAFCFKILCFSCNSCLLKFYDFVLRFYVFVVRFDDIFNNFLLLFCNCFFKMFTNFILWIFSFSLRFYDFAYLW